MEIVACADDLFVRLADSAATEDRGHSWRSATPDEVAWALAIVAQYERLGDTRTALADALALADLYPAPTPEETALIDSQVAAALSQFRALDDPPADVATLAAAVVAWRTEVML